MQKQDVDIGWRAMKADVRPLCCGTECRLDLDGYQPEVDGLSCGVVGEDKTVHASVRRSIETGSRRSFGVTCSIVEVTMTATTRTHGTLLQIN